MRNVGIALVVLVFSSAALADVATPRPQWTSVQLKSESVNITLSDKKVSVEATFEMVNLGKAGPAQMGYPLGILEKSLNDFQVSVNGQAVKDVRTQKAGAASGPALYGGGPGAGRGGATTAAEPYRFEGPYKEWQTWDVQMDANATATVKVSYSVEPAALTDAKLGNLLVYSYTLKTGATWKGNIESAVIRLKLDGVDPARIIRTLPANSNKSDDGKTLTWTLANFKPTDDIEVTFCPPNAEAAANR